MRNTGQEETRREFNKSDITWPELSLNCTVSLRQWSSRIAGPEKTQIFSTGLRLQVTWSLHLIHQIK